MTLSKIRFIQLNNCNQAYQWLKENRNERIILPLQPIVIEDEPNILPIQYFIPPDPAQEFEKYKLLFNEINLKAPQQVFSKKALQQLTNDLFHQSPNNMDHLQSINWLSAALKCYLNHPTLKNFKKQENQKIIEIANWVNRQYENVLFFGWDDNYLSQIELLLNHLTTPISWLIPAPINESKEMSLTDFLMLNRVKLGKSEIQTQSLNLFQTPHEEVKQVLGILKQRAGQTVLVIPNQQIREIVQTEAIQQSISIADEPLISLDQTQLGKIVMAALNYLKRPHFEELKELVFSYHWPGNLNVKLKINEIESDIGFSNHFINNKKRLVGAFEEDHFIHQLVELKNINEIIELIRAHVEIGLENNQSSLVFQHLEAHFTGAKNHQDPLNYLEFMIKKSNILVSAKTASLICISPESIGRYPDYPIWLMGLGDTSWSINKKHSYLTVDILNGLDHAQQLRLGLALWGITHPKLIGISMAEFVNKQQDHLLEGIEIPVRRLKNQINHKVNFVRKQPNIKSKPEEFVLSPSKLQLYQRCPYAFYLKYKLGLNLFNEKMSDHQIIGVTIHQLIEAIVKNKHSNELFILEWTKNHLNPLMAKIIQTKIADEWPIQDFISFCHDKNGIVKTEETLSIVINNQKVEGRADIMIENENEIELVDIKTGKAPSKADIKNYEDIQLGLYLMMIDTNKPMNAYYFSKKNQLKPMIKADDNDIDQILDGVKSRAMDLINAIKAGQFLPGESISSPMHHANQCRVCDYYKVCHSPDRHQR